MENLLKKLNHTYVLIKKYGHMGAVSSIRNNIRGILLIKKYEYFLTI